MSYDVAGTPLRPSLRSPRWEDTIRGGQQKPIKMATATAVKRDFLTSYLTGGCIKQERAHEPLATTGMSSVQSSVVG